MLTERDLENPDPLRLDREIARAAGAVRVHRRSLERGESGDGDPFMTTRLVAGRTAFFAVKEMPDADPLKVPLLRWVYRLADERINRVAIERVEAERRLVEHVVSEPERARVAPYEMLRRGLASKKRREAWLGSFVASSEPTGNAVALLWERRQELAQRLRLNGPDDVEGIGANAEEAARAWLDGTRDAFTEGMRAERGLSGLSGLVTVALGEGAVQGWPRHLLPRTILDLFRDTDLFRDVDLHPGNLPEALAPASFLRALGKVGAAWVDANAPADQPFVVGHDPYGLARRTIGALLACLPASAAFAKHALGIDKGAIADHRRALAMVLLVASRALALRVVLRQAALAGRRAFRDAFEGEVHGAFGIALPAPTAGSIFRLREDDISRFAGLLLAAKRAVVFRDANDEDWYRNPRTVEQLRDEARLSPECSTTNEALAAGARALEASLLGVL